MTNRKWNYTHRIALTQVKDLKQKKADIALILKESMSSREYLTILQKRYAIPELPNPDQAMPMIPNTLANASSAINKITAASIQKLKRPARKDAVKQLRQMRNYIEDLLAELGKE